MNDLLHIMINYSIIIPHKNSPHLLQRCLDSIPNRDDIQVIVVDDNSDSNIVDFENFPGKNRTQVEVYHIKKSRGAGYARNIGLQHVRGKWVLFSDADDYYNPDFDKVLDTYCCSNYDIIYYNVTSDNNVCSSYNRVNGINLIYERYLNGKIDLNSFKYLNWAPWNKMFSSALIFNNNITFEEIPVGNDAFFSFKAAELASKIVVIQEPLYCLTFNPNSITFSRRNFEKEFNYLKVNIRINRFLREHNVNDYQIPLWSIKSLLWVKDYGIDNVLKYHKYIIKHDSLLRYILLYFKSKFL